MVHGPEGLGGVRADGADRVDLRSGRRHADRAGGARGGPGEVLLVVDRAADEHRARLGIEPRCLSLLAGYALMGGAFASGGNVTPRAEANVWMDPEAAARVFDGMVGRRTRCRAASGSR